MPAKRRAGSSPSRFGNPAVFLRKKDASLRLFHKSSWVFLWREIFALIYGIRFYEVSSSSDLNLD